jgi:hypothetical protein
MRVSKRSSNLRDYLLEHPALVWLLGFLLHLSMRSAWGFDVNASLPTTRHPTQILRQIPNPCFQFLRDESVCLLQQHYQALFEPLDARITTIALCGDFL